MKGAASNIPAEVPKDFASVSLMSEQPMFITIAPEAGIKTLPALIEAAKNSRRNFLRGVGRGRQSHLTGEMIERRTDIKLSTVPYSGGPAQAMGDLMGGRVQMLIEGGTALIGAMQSGKLHGLAVGSATRLRNSPICLPRRRPFRISRPRAGSQWSRLGHARADRTEGQRRSARRS